VLVEETRHQDDVGSQSTVGDLVAMGESVHGAPQFGLSTNV